MKHPAHGQLVWDGCIFGCIFLATLVLGCKATDVVGSQPSKTGDAATTRLDAPGVSPDDKTDGAAPATTEAGPLPIIDAARPPTGSCGLTQPAFCDTFEAPSPGGNAGDLDDTEWSAARIGSGGFEQGRINRVGPTTLVGCGTTRGNLGAVTSTNLGIMPPADLSICSGGSAWKSSHLSMSWDDHGSFNIQSFRIRRPFDFAGRTGIIAFDVDGHGAVPGGHGFWMNVCIASDPVPAPYQDGVTTALYPKAGLCIEFEGGGQGFCPSPLYGGDGTCNAVSNFINLQNYNGKQSKAHRPKEGGYYKTLPASLAFRTTYDEVLNHMEVHISESRVEVFASDAGAAPSTMHSVAVVDKATSPEFFPLPLTRGYVNFQQTHYNAPKYAYTDPTCTDVCCTEGEPAPADCTGTCARTCPVQPSYHTYHWDNIGFDGPVFPTPRAYEVPDTIKFDAAHPENGTDTGWILLSNGVADNHTAADQKKIIAPFSIPNVDLTNATDALLTMNLWFTKNMSGNTFAYRFNDGAWRTATLPFDTADALARVAPIPVALSDLKQGTNTLEMKSDDYVYLANLELTVNVR
jgi:hypothetical protein